MSANQPFRISAFPHNWFYLLFVNSDTHDFLGGCFVQPDVPQDDLLNWDAWIEVAPKRPSRKLRVHIRNIGRGRPMPIEDPWS